MFSYVLGFYLFRLPIRDIHVRPRLTLHSEPKTPRRPRGITTDADRAVCIRRCEEFGIEMVPFPCPETRYLGVPRSPGSYLDRLNTPEFAALLDQLEADVRSLLAGRGEDSVAVLGVNSSPTCGVTSTYYSKTKSPGAGVFLKRFSDLPLIDVSRFARYPIEPAAPVTP